MGIFIWIAEEKKALFYFSHLYHEGMGAESATQE